jgi:hypothetical protein
MIMEANKLGKSTTTAVLDKILDEIATATEMTVCSGSPATYTDAHTTNVLARWARVSGSFVKGAGTPDGRALTVAAATSGSITSTADAMTVCLNRIADTTLLYTTSCSTQTLSSGGTVDTNAWVITIRNPT